MNRFLIILIIIGNTAFGQNSEIEKMPIKKLKPMTIEEYDIWDTIPAKDSVKFSFDQLNDQDTLSISAFIADCGEFGGHKEFLKCYNTGDSYCIQHYM